MVPALGEADAGGLQVQAQGGQLSKTVSKTEKGLKVKLSVVALCSILCMVSVGECLLYHKVTPEE